MCFGASTSPVHPIHNEMLKRGGDALAGALHRLFSHMWRTERWPEQWQAGRITAIHKGGDKEEVDNYRGITLLLSVAKLFEVVVNTRLYAWARRAASCETSKGGSAPTGGATTRCSYSTRSSRSGR